MINYQLKKKYKNPFFRNKKNYLSLRLKIILSCIIIFILAMVWFFCFSNVFKIKKVNINGLTQIPQHEIQNLIQQQIEKNYLILASQNNLILFSANQAIEVLEKKYCFKQIIIKKNLPDQLIINIQENPYAFIWREKDLPAEQVGKYYLVSANHCVINEINPLDIQLEKYPIIYNETEVKIIKFTSQVFINIDHNYTEYVIELFKQFNNNQDKKDNLKIEKFIIDQDINTIKMVILNGPQIYFNVKEDLMKQINKFIAIKNQLLKNNFWDIDYIDLKYGDKVYYK
ncbi:MAG: FtsQ-type POTRA domain-containing protein [Patescibacteria group bacterium]